MAVAIAYPDAQQGKRNDLTSSKLEEVKQRRSIASTQSPTLHADPLYARFPFSGAHATAHPNLYGVQVGVQVLTRKGLKIKPFSGLPVTASG